MPLAAPPLAPKPRRFALDLVRHGLMAFLRTRERDHLPEVIRAAGHAGLSTLPGALAPFEIVSTWRAEASAVKAFPVARASGPPYNADVHTTRPEIPLVQTGGVTAEEAAAYRAAETVAVAVDSPLVGDALDGGSLREPAARTQDFTVAAAVL